MAHLIASAGGVDIRHMPLKRGRTTLGRKPHNDLVFDNLVVSGEHCAFDRMSDGTVYLEDRGSTNGTYVNGELIEHRMRLKHQDIIVVGNFRLEFLSPGQEPAPVAQRETNAMSLDALGLPGTSGARRACIQVLTGDDAGTEQALVKAVTTFGRPDGAVVSILHRRNGYFVARVDGVRLPTLNGSPVGHEAVPLAHRDILNLAGVEMEFLLKDA